MKAEFTRARPLLCDTTNSVYPASALLRGRITTSSTITTINLGHLAGTAQHLRGQCLSGPSPGACGPPCPVLHPLNVPKATVLCQAPCPRSSPHMHVPLPPRRAPCLTDKAEGPRTQPARWKIESLPVISTILDPNTLQPPKSFPGVWGAGRQRKLRVNPTSEQAALWAGRLACCLFTHSGVQLMLAIPLVCTVPSLIEDEKGK